MGESKDAMMEVVRIATPDPGANVLRARVLFSFSDQGDMDNLSVEVSAFNPVDGSSDRNAPEPANVCCKVSPLVTQFLSSDVGVFGEFASMCRFLRQEYTPRRDPRRYAARDSNGGAVVVRDFAISLGSVAVDVCDDLRAVFNDVQVAVQGHTVIDRAEASSRRSTFQLSCASLFLLGGSSGSDFSRLMSVTATPSDADAAQAAPTSPERVTVTMESRDSFHTREQSQSTFLVSLPEARTKRSIGVRTRPSGVCMFLETEAWEAAFSALRRLSAPPYASYTDLWKELFQWVDDSRYSERSGLAESVQVPLLNMPGGLPATQLPSSRLVPSTMSVRIPMLSLAVVTVRDVPTGGVVALRLEAKDLVVESQSLRADCGGPPLQPGVNVESLTFVEARHFIAAFEQTDKLLQLCQISSREDDRPRVQLHSRGGTQLVQTHVSFDFQKLFAPDDEVYARIVGAKSTLDVPILFQSLDGPKELANDGVSTDFLEGFVGKSDMAVSCILPVLKVFCAADTFHSFTDTLTPSLSAISTAAQAWIFPPDPPPFCWSLLLVSEDANFQFTQSSGRGVSSGVKLAVANLSTCCGSDPLWTSSVTLSSSSSNRSWYRYSEQSAIPTAAYFLGVVNYSTFDVSDGQRRLMRSTPLLSSLQDSLVSSDISLSCGELSGTHTSPSSRGRLQTSVQLRRFTLCSSAAAWTDVWGTVSSFTNLDPSLNSEETAGVSTDLARGSLDSDPVSEGKREADEAQFPSRVNHGSSFRIVGRDITAKYLSSAPQEVEEDSALLATLSQFTIRSDGSLTHNLDIDEVAVWLKANEHHLRNDEVLLNLCAADMCATRERPHEQTHLAKKSMVLVFVLSKTVVRVQPGPALIPQVRDVFQDKQPMEVDISFPSTVSHSDVKIQGEQEFVQAAVFCIRCVSCVCTFSSGTCVDRANFLL
jgi:hypothetical protein